MTIPDDATGRASTDDSDIGLANVRTALSWQRTALTTAAGAGGVARLTVDRVGLPAVIVLGVALLLGLWLFSESWWRYAHDAGLRQRPRSRSGRAPAVLAVAVALVAATELAALVSAA